MVVFFGWDLPDLIGACTMPINGHIRGAISRVTCPKLKCCLRFFWREIFEIEIYHRLFLILAYETYGVPVRLHDVCKEYVINTSRSSFLRWIQIVTARCCSYIAFTSLTAPMISSPLWYRWPQYSLINIQMSSTSSIVSDGVVVWFKYTSDQSFRLEN